MWKIKIDEMDAESLKELGIAAEATNLLGFEMSAKNNVVDIEPTMLIHKIKGISAIMDDFINDIATIIAEILDTKVSVLKDDEVIFEYDGKETGAGLNDEIRDLSNKIGMRIVKWIKEKV